MQLLPYTADVVCTMKCDVTYTGMRNKQVDALGPIK